MEESKAMSLIKKDLCVLSRCVSSRSELLNRSSMSSSLIVSWQKRKKSRLYQAVMENRASILNPDKNVVFKE